MTQRLTYLNPTFIINKIIFECGKIFSLGIILYEMFHIFSTQMERVTHITQLRSGRINDETQGIFLINSFCKTNIPSRVVSKTRGTYSATSPDQSRQPPGGQRNPRPSFHHRGRIRITFTPCCCCISIYHHLMSSLLSIEAETAENAQLIRKCAEKQVQHICFFSRFRFCFQFVKYLYTYCKITVDKFI